jgi:hypothetical protein
VKQIIEHGARYPVVLDPDDEEFGNQWTTRERTGKEEAQALVNYVNSRARSRGFPERAYVVERVVMIGEWEPVGASESQVLRGGITE